MSEFNNRLQGDHLAIAAAFRVLAMGVAKIANKDDPEHWFISLGQSAMDYIDLTSNPNLDEKTSKAVKEAAYETIRMIFDPSGFK